jgi:saccharopine dehydrogenase (NAD+, L-lysine-forming)
MSASKILVLGGYGLAGFPLGRLLLEHTAANVVLAGRSREKAESAADELASAHPGRVHGIAADAATRESLDAALSAVDLVVDCTPTTRNVEMVTAAAIDASVDYLDILYGPGKLSVLEKKADLIRDAGLCFVTEGGYHPGLPSTLVRYAATQLDTLDSAVVAGVLHQPIPYTEAVTDLVREIQNSKQMAYEDGNWREISWSEIRQIDFGPPFGVQPCYAMDFPELHGLPEQLGIDELGCYMAGWGKAIDWGVIGVWYALRLGRFDWGARLGARLMCWLSYRTIKPPYGVVLKLEAEGSRRQEPVRLEVYIAHDDGYMLTAVPTAACLMQLLDGSIRRPGLHMMGHIVDPVRLMADMEGMGVSVSRHMVGAPASAS